MRVKLIATTPNPIEVMYISARTCYSPSSPNDMFEKTIVVENAEKLVKQVLGSGHQSIAEHVNFTFAIEGISRACSHQLVRHRHCTFSQQSQRYVEIKEDYDQVKGLVLSIDPTSSSYNKDELDENETKLQEILTKYFVITEDSLLSLGHALMYYLDKTRKGIKPEDARNDLPNATKTNLVMTCNLRELMHMCNLRLCTRAQKEIRNLFKAIAEEVKNNDDFIGRFLVPSCEVNGFCTEHKCCGRKPAIKELHNLNAEKIVEEKGEK